MKSKLLALIAPLLASTALLSASVAAEIDPGIIIGKYYPSPFTEPDTAIYVVWPSQTNVCQVGGTYNLRFANASIEAPPDLCYQPFSLGSNPNFTNVWAVDCGTTYANLKIEPVTAGASPTQRCIPYNQGDRICENAVNYETYALCGGPLTTTSTG